jgi:hypothetical protein
MADRWFQGGQDGPAEIRAALEGVIAVFAEHGPVLQALADAATDDPDVEAVYRGLIDRFVTATAEHVGREISAGHIEGLHDPDEMSRALVLLNERYLLATMGRGQTISPHALLETLTRIWVCALY